MLSKQTGLVAGDRGWTPKLDGGTLLDEDCPPFDRYGALR